MGVRIMFSLLIIVIIIIACKDEVNSIIRTLQKRDVEGEDSSKGKELNKESSDVKLQEYENKINLLTSKVNKLKVENEVLKLNKEDLLKENNKNNEESDIKE